MRNEAIRRAYDSVLPDSEARERMLKNILSGASNTRPEGRTSELKTRNIRKIVIILAAALAAALSVSVIAYAADLFGFRALVMAERTQAGGTDRNYRISVSQPQDVPEGTGTEIAGKLEKNRQALEEWQAREIPGKETRFMHKYDFHYDTRTMEEETLLEKIAEKYGLRLRGQMTLLQISDSSTEEDVCTRAEAVEAVSGACCSGALFYETPVGFDKVYYYDEGTFCVSWYVNLPSSGVEYTCYGYNSMYDTFSTGGEAGSVQDDIDSFDERKHTAPDGTELTILSNGNEAYIYVYLENSFFTERLYPDVCMEDRGSCVLTDEDIDYIADCIDYSVIGK